MLSPYEMGKIPPPYGSVRPCREEKRLIVPLIAGMVRPWEETRRLPVLAVRAVLFLDGIRASLRQTQK